MTKVLELDFSLASKILEEVGDGNVDPDHLVDQIGCSRAKIMSVIDQLVTLGRAELQELDMGDYSMQLVRNPRGFAQDFDGSGYLFPWEESS